MARRLTAPVSACSRVATSAISCRQDAVSCAIRTFFSADAACDGILSVQTSSCPGQHYRTVEALVAVGAAGALGWETALDTSLTGARPTHPDAATVTAT